MLPRLREYGRHLLTVIWRVGMSFLSLSRQEQICGKNSLLFSSLKNLEESGRKKTVQRGFDSKFIPHSRTSLYARLTIFVLSFRILVTSESSGLIETITDAVSVHSIKKDAYARTATDGTQIFTSFTLLDHYIEVSLYLLVRSCITKPDRL